MQSSANTKTIFNNDGLLSEIEARYPSGEPISLENREQIKVINYWFNRYLRSEQIKNGSMKHNFKELYWEDIMKIFKDTEDYEKSPERRRIFSKMIKSQALSELSKICGYGVRKEEDIADLYKYFVTFGDRDIESLFRR